MPSAVCSYPEAALVGMREANARDIYGDVVRTYQTAFQPLFYSLTDRSQTSFTKVVVQGDTDRIVGIHMVGDHAGEIIQSLTIALQLSVTKQDLDQAIGIHPSSAEAVASLK